MKKHLKYLKSNINNDARIIINFDGRCIIYPACIEIRKATADKLIEELNLMHVAAYLDHRNHSSGSQMYVFAENYNKY